MLYKWECKDGEGSESAVAEAELKLIELLIADEPENEEYKNFLKMKGPEPKIVEVD